MHMIGHSHETIQLYRRKALWKFFPYGLHNLTLPAQMHLTIDDLPKFTFAIFNTYGDQVKSWLAVIIIFQAYRATIGSRAIGKHYTPPLVSSIFCIFVAIMIFQF